MDADKRRWREGVAVFQFAFIGVHLRFQHLMSLLGVLGVLGGSKLQFASFSNSQERLS